VKRVLPVVSIAAGLLLAAVSSGLCQHPTPARRTYLGFDRNDYPGDTNLNLLRQSFVFTGYWLNTPPGASGNTWTGKRQALIRAGFGFVVLFNGRLYKQIKASGDTRTLGTDDGNLAAAAARHEGFPPHTVIFLDQEEGGRLLPEQRSYLMAWAAAVQADGFQPGVYCSGIPFQESPGTRVVTAEDIRQNAPEVSLVYWVTNDACPPSPGCALPRHPPEPGSSGVSFAQIWQFAQSPRRPAYAAQCSATYSNDGNCYPSGAAAAQHLFVDLNVATSSDPSHGRGRDQR
jgi:Rv2525c-like, glycoside hydrolase-like domain